MADGLHSVVFVAGSTDGWLLWNTDGDLHTPEQAVRLVGQNSLAAFDRTDLMVTGRAHQGRPMTSHHRIIMSWNINRVNAADQSRNSANLAPIELVIDLCRRMAGVDAAEPVPTRRPSVAAD